jgi:ClpP class serine protease
MDLNAIINLIFLLFLISFIYPLLQRRRLTSRRIHLINELERKRHSRVITLIHRQEALSLFGFPLIRYIDIDDSERVLRAIRMTDDKVPIDIILHTPGGLVLASEQIAWALKRHKAKVTAFIPHYAMSGGTMIALAADKIVMDHGAVFGPIDPQIGDPFRGSFPAASILSALSKPNPNRDDQTLILGDIAKKAIRQMQDKVCELLSDKMSSKEAQRVAKILTGGQWTHDYPITPKDALSLNLNISTELPKEVYQLMDLYPQAPQRRPSVEYIPIPYGPSRKKS